MIRVLLADDHPVMREILYHLLRRADDLQIVAVASDGTEAVDQTVMYSPDIVVIDSSMPGVDGIEATKQICVRHPQTRVLILSGYSDSEHIQRSLQAGAIGYVLKDFLVQDLITAVRSLSQGKPYFSKQIVEIAEIYMKRKI